MTRKRRDESPTRKLEPVSVVCARCDTLVDRAGWERHAVACERKNQDKVLDKVASEYLGVHALSGLVDDALGIVELTPAQIKAALLAAYRAGYLERGREIP